MSIAMMDAGFGDIHQLDLPYRSPSIRREPKISGNKLRNLYQTGFDEELENGGGLGLAIDSAVPILPLTPPNVEGEEQDDDPSTSDTTRMRSVLVTPVNNLSPPTPDITPPREQNVRHFLGARPSMASTYAESFKTAREDISSEFGSSLSLPTPRRGGAHRQSPALHLQHKPSPLIQTFFYESDISGADNSPQPKPTSSFEKIKSLASEHNYDDSPILPSELFPPLIVPEKPRDNRPVDENHSPPPIARTGPSLRERLEESHVLPRSRSLDKFANIIGWNEGVQAGSNKRWSGVSTSTISAIVVDQPQPWKRRTTLRHVSKKESLRSASSPLPPSQTNSNSPHQLTHKTARLSNRNRESFGSTHSRSLSFGSSVPTRKLEIIRVAVIPERISSLQDAPSSVRPRSPSASARRTRRASDNQGNLHTQDPLSTEASDRGRDRYYPPQVGPFTVPVRSSSLSAPTSRNTSRANSLNSESIRSARKQAELDLRSTLNQMESERLASSLKSLTIDTKPPAPALLEVKAHDFASGIASNAEHHVYDAANLRPPSFHATLHSAPSFLSASPEINEAKAVSFFPHNNHSIQVIDPTQLSESKAVQLMRHHAQRTQSDSPFREPRVAPTPPQATSTTTTEPPLLSDPNQPRPPRGPTRADSFGRTMMHTISLKRARNRKVNQNIDAASHPMWRPRPFWDDADAQKPRVEDDYTHDRGVIQNSVGIPQQRGAFAGPVALMHRISKRRRTRKAIVKQSSFTSLHRLRTGKRLYRIPGLGIHLQMMTLKDIQARVATRRLRREEERQEQRRADVRKTIGANVISMGDSRIPANFV